jgi:glycosyltransferase involved in cell wall biosynthesis
VLEVLASGVPLLATAVGGIPEIFGEHSDSLLPSGDVEALAGAMAGFLRDPGTARERAAGMRDHVARHVRVPDMVDATVELYGTVLGRRVEALATPR